jgi:hypothetical protein
LLKNRVIFIFGKTYQFNHHDSIMKKTEKQVDACLPLIKTSVRTPCGPWEQSEILLKAIAQKQRALTGEFLYPKPDGYRPQRSFPGGFPNYEASSPIRHRPSPMPC